MLFMDRIMFMSMFYVSMYGCSLLFGIVTDDDRIYQLKRKNCQWSKILIYLLNKI